MPSETRNRCHHFSLQGDLLPIFNSEPLFKIGWFDCFFPAHCSSTIVSQVCLLAFRNWLEKNSCSPSFAEQTREISTENFFDAHVLVSAFGEQRGERIETLRRVEIRHEGKRIIAFARRGYATPFAIRHFGAQIILVFRCGIDRADAAVGADADVIFTAVFQRVLARYTGSHSRPPAGRYCADKASAKCRSRRPYQRACAMLRRSCYAADRPPPNIRRA